MAQTAKCWKMVRPFVGTPRLEDFEFVEETVSPDLKPGGILVEAEYLSVDPYQRLYGSSPGNTMFGEQISRVKKSNNPAFPEGCLVQTYAGWRTLTVIPNPDEQLKLYGTMARRLTDFLDLPVSLGLGCLGMPGLTAYFGLLEKGKVKEGETVLVSGAAGAVGSVVGQIAKIKGCTVIGSSGSQEKCDWLKELGFDHVFNYKERTVDDALKEFAPQGIELYFDNVGGDFSFAVLTNHLKPVIGRLVSCGCTSEYNTESTTGQSIFKTVIFKQLEIRGFNIYFFKERFPQVIPQLLQWVKEGKLKYRETVTEGFEHMPEAFISLFHGANVGKAIIQI